MKPQVALTFDDGPDPKTTSAILQVLAKYEVKATFMIWGEHARQYPQLVNQEQKVGHALGSHTFSHQSLLKLTNLQIKQEIQQTDSIIQAAAGVTPQFCRPPYGEIDCRTLKAINRPAIRWSLDSQDWLTHDAKKTLINVQRANDGDIVLMHDIQSSTVEAIAQIILSLRSRAFQFVTIPELLSSQMDRHYLYESQFQAKKLYD